MRFLYLIIRDEGADYDENSAMVICALTESAARLYAMQAAKDEGPPAWREGYTSIVQIGVASPDVELGVVLADYRAG